MHAPTNIGTLIARSPEIRGGRPRIAGTGVTVRRIVGWYRLGLSAEEIAEQFGHLSLGQVYAALTYYHANREEIDADLAAEEALTEALERQRPQAGYRRVTLRLYMDEDSMSQALVRALRVRGVDVLTAEEANMIERLDADHLAYAASEGRTACTFNISDFWTLHGEYLADGRSHAGIVLMPQQRYRVGELLRRLLRLSATLSPAAIINRAEFLSAWDPLG